MAEIVASGLGKYYDVSGGKRVWALQDLNFTIRSGEFVCLLGPSGCGKTTLLNILGGLEPNYVGSFAIRNETQARLGYMFQEPRLLPWRTVAGNLRFVLDAHVNKREIELWLGRMGLAGYSQYFPGQLSIGMQQRVAVARALITQPDVLFMDEPFSALDELTAMKVRGELLKLWHEQRCTVVFVTHNPLEAVYLADRVFVMSSKPGRIAEEIDVAGHFSRPRDVEDANLWKLSRLAVSYLQAETSL